ncbi:hypothetical protein ACPA9J_05390 [Pseudomonas aeruginosa]
MDFKLTQGGTCWSRRCAAFVERNCCPRGRCPTRADAVCGAVRTDSQQGPRRRFLCLQHARGSGWRRPLELPIPRRWSNASCRRSPGPLHVFVARPSKISWPAPENSSATTCCLRRRATGY